MHNLILLAFEQIFTYLSSSVTYRPNEVKLKWIFCLTLLLTTLTLIRLGREVQNDLLVYSAI